MTADEILAITSPESLFPFDTLDRAYKELAKKWHPDINKHPKSAEVFMHISTLHTVAVEKVRMGAWGFAGAIQFRDKLGSLYKMKYRYYEPFELGEMYVADRSLCYIVAEKHKRLFHNGINAIKDFKFGSDSLKEIFPKIKKSGEIDDGRLFVVFEKTSDVLPLSVVLNYYNGKIEPKSAAWIISCLHNTACALKFSKVAHNDISTSTYFVSPKYHTGLLLGGWWYTVPSGSKLIGVPQRTFMLMPYSQKNTKVATSKLDAELLRAVGREVLGDKSGNTLVQKGVPKVMADWVNIPSSRHPYDDYSKWGEVLTKAFGPRKFIPMEIDVQDAYNKMSVKR